jgi:hypothetical protein
MKNVPRVLVRVLTIAFALACSRLSAVTVAVADGFYNTPIGVTETGTFTATCDAVPSISPSNTTISLCSGAQTAYTGLAAMARFSSTGAIDARNGGAFAAVATIPFSAGVSYHFRFVVSMSTHTYSLYVTPAGGSEITVGSNYAFRTEQAAVASLDTWNIDVNTSPGGSVTVTNLAVGTSVAVADGFYNVTMGSTQSGSFTATCDASTSISPSNATISLCSGTQSAYTGLAVMARFNPTGFIDARNGGVFAADTSIPFSAGVTYHFRMVVNVATHTYSIYVTPSGGSELTVGTNYAFRTEQAAVASLNTWNVDVNTSPGGSVTVENLAVATTAQVAPPAFSPAGGTYSTAQNVTITPGTTGASIRYTTNGTTPTSTTGTLYSGPVSISTTTTLKAISYKSGMLDSTVTTATYTISASVPSTPVFSPAAGTFSSAQSVTITSSGATTIYYTTDGTTPTTASTVYSGPVSITTTKTLKAIGVNSGGSSPVTTGVYTISVPDFSITVAPSSVTVATNSTGTVTATIAAINSFTGTVTFTATGLPTGATATFSPTSVADSGSTTVTLTTASSTPAGTSTVTIKGTSGALNHSTTFSLVVTRPAWVHPGVGVTKNMLDYSKAQAAAGIEPWATALTNMKNDATYGPLSYTPVPWQTVECGSSSNPNFGCSDERRDAMAAYTQALLWYFTGNQTYANNAIKIMNAWSSTLTGGHTNSNAPLQAGWTGSVWPRAAEIIRYTNAGWAAADVTAFQNMLRTQYLPNVINGACQNGNWEAVMLLAVMNISVFNEDLTSYNTGVTLWQGRLPAYIYLTSDGSSPMAPGHCSLPSWFGLTTFVNGIAQETCRDFGHCEWGIEGLLLAAESDRAQAAGSHSQNLYGQLNANSRFFNTYEFHCTYLNGATAPSWLCSGAPTLGYVQCFEAGYNHLVNRSGYTMPQTAQYLATKRPTGVNYFIGWETMTYFGQGTR